MQNKMAPPKPANITDGDGGGTLGYSIVPLEALQPYDIGLIPFYRFLLLIVLLVNDPYILQHLMPR